MKHKYHLLIACGLTALALALPWPVLPVKADSLTTNGHGNIIITWDPLDAMVTQRQFLALSNRIEELASFQRLQDQMFTHESLMNFYQLQKMSNRVAELERQWRLNPTNSDYGVATNAPPPPTWSFQFRIPGALPQFSKLYLTNLLFWGTNIAITNSPGTVKPTEKSMEQAAKDGDICKALGHVWELVPHVTLEYRADGNYPQVQKCRVCGLTQSRQYTDWH